MRIESLLAEGIHSADQERLYRTLGTYYSIFTMSAVSCDVIRTGLTSRKVMYTIILNLPCEPRFSDPLVGHRYIDAWL